MKLISRTLAVKILLVLLSTIVLFHLLVLFKVISPDMVWGGKFNSYDELFLFEVISLALNISFIFLVRYRARRPESKPGRIGMWLMFALFALNTLGNLFAETLIEKLTATPITLILALLSLRLALKEK